jgi:hypothetical protein
MSFNQQMIEEIATWCLTSPELVSEREEARQRFFADDDPRPMKYWPGAETRTSRERRFSGYFMFDHVLPNGEKPGEVAVKHLYSGTFQVEPLKAVRGVQFVLAVVSSIIGRSVYLEIENDSFEVRSSVWAAQLRIGQGVVAHLVPVRHGYWLPGPGWLVWPIGLGPGIRSSLKSFQLDPVSLERFLQGRVEEGDEAPRPAPPRDGTLEEAVARMTEAAASEDHEGLVMSVGQWKALVWKHLNNPHVAAFGQEIVKRVGDVKDLKDLQRWLDLAVNIWNNTPQPDRGGKSASELANQWRDASGPNTKKS